MVFRGKPSAGCHSCRARRIKCDKKRPGCTQCMKISIICPGYRNLEDLLWRHENDSVARKAEASYAVAAKKRRNNASSSDESSPEAMYNYGDLMMPIERLLCFQPLEEIGLTHFMSSYVPGSHFDYLPMMYEQANHQSPLRSIVQAASLANFSRDTEDPNLLRSARNHYAKALVMTNADLQNPALTTLDSTLASVLLLSLFEAMVWDGVDAPSNWTAHIMGALAIVKLRGAKQFQTDLGWRLFKQVSNNIRSSCIQNGQRLPPDLRSIHTTTVKPLLGANDPRVKLEPLLAELTELNADIREGRMRPSDIIRHSLALDHKFVLLARGFPKYKEIDSRDGYSDAYGLVVYDYPNYDTTQLWSSYRMIRILLSEIIFRSSPHDSTLSEEARQSLQHQAGKTVERMVHDVCAGVPPVLRLSPVSGSYRSRASSLLWPLSIVRSASQTPAPARQYAVAIMQRLGRELKYAPVKKVIEDTEYRLGVVENGFHIFYLI